MKSVTERLHDFINANSAYVLSQANLKIFADAVISKQSGPGGGNLHQVYQFKPAGDAGDPNTRVFSPTTEYAVCLDADRTDRAWVKTDGIISNTGWTEISAT